MFGGDNIRKMRLWRAGWVLLVGVMADQVLKFVARQSLNETYHFQWGPVFVRFELAENPGAFLSLGANWPEPWRGVILNGLVVGILGWALISLVRRSFMPRWERWGFYLLVAGGMGNFLDRLWKGSVTDYIQLGVGFLATGIFNFADVLIMGAFFLMLLGPVIWPDPEPQSNP